MRCDVKSGTTSDCSHVFHITQEPYFTIYNGLHTVPGQDQSFRLVEEITEHKLRSFGTTSDCSHVFHITQEPYFTIYNGLHTAPGQDQSLKLVEVITKYKLRSL
ncbi:hypothetical protein J6590_087091 [Homalodisca vitripennis]|nr:hypothetical protein J6590_087091 [Homalodisca vitripennis]